jgi:hypothetical protein
VEALRQGRQGPQDGTAPRPLGLIPGYVVLQRATPQN